ARFHRVLRCAGDGQFRCHSTSALAVRNIRGFSRTSPSIAPVVGTFPRRRQLAPTPARRVKCRYRVANEGGGIRSFVLRPSCLVPGSSSLVPPPRGRGPEAR